jgi:hypothetical protein
MMENKLNFNICRVCRVQHSAIFGFSSLFDGKQEIFKAISDVDVSFQVCVLSYS